MVIGLDDHIERRRGAKIAAKGIYRDAVRSSKSFFVKTSGLRWVCMMVLAPIPWAQRIWALPFLTVLAPSERYHAERGLRHKTLTAYLLSVLAESPLHVQFAGGFVLIEEDRLRLVSTAGLPAADHGGLRGLQQLPVPGLEGRTGGVRRRDGAGGHGLPLPAGHLQVEQD